MRRKGIPVESVLPGSPAEKAGIHAGDSIVSVDGNPVRDVIDFMFHKSPGPAEYEVVHEDRSALVHVDTGEEGDPGLMFRPFKVTTCRNNCIFCFVRQLPKNLRRSLYIKDDDYRLSFLYGNYITLAQMGEKEKQRIISQRLSPLYVSVHSTDDAVRRKMLGNPRAFPIMKELKFFCDRKIRIHTQIVLCPGYNDGPHLEKTIRDLYRFYPYVSSIAVVPVGLTSHGRLGVTPVSRGTATEAISTVERFQKRFRKKHNDTIVYCSDEMYITADRAFPKFSWYGGFPQIENGVGMIPLFLNQARKISFERPPADRKFVTFSGTSFHPYLQKFITRLSEKEQVDIEVLPVENQFFGPSVTVTGLLSGRDVIREVLDTGKRHDTLIVPESALKDDEDVFIDDVSIADMEDATGMKVVKTDGTPQGLVDTISAPYGKELKK